MLRIFSLVLIITLAGCSSQNSQFYLLNEIPRDQVKTVHMKDHSNIGLGPVNFPRYLNQPQIVTRQTNTQLNLNEFHRWAEPLDDNSINVIRNNLANMLRPSHIYSYPWRHSDKITYQIRLDITRFDADETGNVVLIARWEILQNDNKKILATNSRTYCKHINPKYTYNDLANCMSQLLGQLSKDLAVATQRHPIKTDKPA